MGLFAADPACTFCGIVSGRVRASRVYEDAEVLAFMEIHPATPGDLLVIPKAHAAGLGRWQPAGADDGPAQSEEAAGRLAAAVRSPARAIRRMLLALADGTSPWAVLASTRTPNPGGNDDGQCRPRGAVVLAATTSAPGAVARRAATGRPRLPRRAAVRLGPAVWVEVTAR
ncbi:HIT domain-containing protein [Streptomyces sp. NPDC046197]|uniref:HIT domain-containing protein n=1 Tax=Streptomyces sp. NPDC046197 TaxID=3154337 RepID=UPI0033F14D0F